MRTFLFLLAGAAALFAAAPLTADEPAESLLEKLSAETERLARRADAQTCVFATEGVQWGGVIIGEPARFVVALDDVAEHGTLPREGKVTMSGGTVVDARLLDGDRDFGLAIYELTGGPWTGLKPAGEATLRRGALAISGGGADPALIVLGRVGGPLEDVYADEAGGIALMAPGGRLLGLRPAAPAARAELVRAATQPLGFLAPIPNPPTLPAPAPVPTPVTAPTVPRLEVRWEPSRSQGAYGQLVVPRGMLHPSTAYVPGTVIERALGDIAQGGRLRRAYLGVVTEAGATYANQGVGYYVTGPNGVVFKPGVGGGGLVYHFPDTVDPASLTPDSISSAGLGLPGSVRLSSVLPDSPAAKAGLEKGHEIVEIDGRPFAGARGFARALARRRPGDEVRLSIKGRDEPIKVVLGDRENDAKDLASTASIGLTVLSLTSDLVAFLDLPKETRGVVVLSVDPGSAAATAGIRRSDVFVSDQAGGPIRDAGELDAVLGAAKGTVVLQGRRGAGNATFSITLPGRGAAPKAR